MRHTECTNCHATLEKIASHSRFCPACRFPLMPVEGGFSLQEVLVKSPMSTLYLASSEDSTELPNPCVLKFPSPSLFMREGNEGRVRDELACLSNASRTSAHLVRIYGTLQQDPVLGHFFVMEYLRGQSLKDWLEQHPDRSPQQIFHLFSQLCKALQSIHSANCVHRDLHPENIFLLSPEHPLPFVKVIDFGLAKPLAGTEGGDLTQGVLGPPYYLSPEQCLNQQVDARSDLYALGVILYEMLTGYWPFGEKPEDAASSLFTTLHAHVSVPPEPLRAVCPEKGYAEELDRLTMKLLSKAPEDRFSTVDEMWSALAKVPVFEGDALTVASLLVDIEALAVVEPALSEEPVVEEPVLAVESTKLRVHRYRSSQRPAWISGWLMLFLGVCAGTSMWSLTPEGRVLWKEWNRTVWEGAAPPWLRSLPPRHPAASVALPVVRQQTSSPRVPPRRLRVLPKALPSAQMRVVKASKKPAPRTSQDTHLEKAEPPAKVSRRSRKRRRVFARRRPQPSLLTRTRPTSLQVEPTSRPFPKRAVPALREQHTKTPGAQTIPESSAPKVALQESKKDIAKQPSTPLSRPIHAKQQIKELTPRVSPLPEDASSPRVAQPLIAQKKAIQPVLSPKHVPVIKRSVVQKAMAAKKIEVQARHDIPCHASKGTPCEPPATQEQPKLAKKPIDTKPLRQKKQPLVATAAAAHKTNEVAKKRVAPPKLALKEPIPPSTKTSVKKPLEATSSPPKALVKKTASTSVAQAQSAAPKTAQKAKTAPAHAVVMAPKKSKALQKKLPPKASPAHTPLLAGFHLLPLLPQQWIGLILPPHKKAQAKAKPPVAVVCGEEKVATNGHCVAVKQLEREAVKPRIHPKLVLARSAAWRRQFAQEKRAKAHFQSFHKHFEAFLFPLVTQPKSPSKRVDIPRYYLPFSKRWVTLATLPLPKNEKIEQEKYPSQKLSLQRLEVCAAQMSLLLQAHETKGLRAAMSCVLAHQEWLLASAEPPKQAREQLAAALYLQALWSMRKLLRVAWEENLEKEPLQGLDDLLQLTQKATSRLKEIGALDRPMWSSCARFRLAQSQTWLSWRIRGYLNNGLFGQRLTMRQKTQLQETDARVRLRAQTLFRDAVRADLDAGVEHVCAQRSLLGLHLLREPASSGLLMPKR